MERNRITGFYRVNTINNTTLPPNSIIYETNELNQVVTIYFTDNYGTPLPFSENVNVTWASIENKPATFPPSTHTHTIANITNLQTTLNSKANVADLPATNQLVPLGGTNGQVLKVDGSGNTIWGTDTNTTYTVIPEAEFNAGTATTARTVNAVSLNRDIQKKINDFIPAPPATGTFILKSVDGVLSWIEEV